MSRWAIARMTQAEAEEVAAWHYPGEYAFYDADAIPEGVAELVDAQLRGDGFFAAHGAGGVEGFVELKPKAGGAVEIGLGLRPDLTGRGLGAAFAAAAIQLARDGGAERITLAVAEFNLRAISVYERAGFVETGRHTRHIFGIDWEFIDMELR
jgi:[ribosomal protein S18]-alanine N-acetyltransferase